jgi:hypothetical protein
VFSAVACNSILDRALGKPKAVEEEKNDMEARLAVMTREQRLQYMRELLEPMQQHLLAAPKQRRISPLPPK